jgi:hypothetical protein
MLMSLHCWSFTAMEEARLTKVLVFVLVLMDAWKKLVQGLLPITGCKLWGNQPNDRTVFPWRV